MSLILYLAGLLVLGTGIYFIRKSDEEQNAVTYLVFTVVLFMIIQSVEAGIINLIPALHINAVTFGCLHILEGIALWYFIFFKKKRQKYFWQMIDIAALGVLAVFVVFVAVRQFGIRLNDFNFELSDSARHYMYARDVADNGHLISLYFSALNSGLIMNALYGMIKSFSFYRIFILFETGVLFLNGAMFWVVIRKYLKDKYSGIMGIIVATVYMLGYPWNSMVFGTSYLSTGILCVAVIIFLLDLYFYNTVISSKRIAVLLLVSCYALARSYVLFVPPVLGVLVLLAAFKFVKSNKMSAKKIYAIGGTFFITCLLAGVIFLYIWLVKGVLDQKLDVLSWWGYTYGTPYADFLFAVPFCVFWIIKIIRSKTINVTCIIFSVFLLYTFVLFLGNYFGKISAYYYYKNYCILWLAVFMVLLRAVIALKNERIFMYSYIITWGLLFLIYISSAEKKLPQDYNLSLTAPSAGQVASDYFGLYNFNIVYGHRDTISKPVKDLYMRAARLSEETGAFIPYIGEYAEDEWTYFALAGAEHRNVLEGKNFEAAVEELQKYPYILSVESEEPMADVSKFLSTLPVAYENESGKIYKVEIGQVAEENLKSDIDVDIILRYGFPKLERMGWVEQDEYVNNLQVIDRIDKLDLNKQEFLYPERVSAGIEDSISYLETGCQNKETIVFNGTTAMELQQVINDNPNTIIDILSKEIELNDTIILKNNTAINGNGVILKGVRLEYGFIGEGVSDIYLNDICLEGKIDYGIYLINCNDINITECKINRLLQKPICIIGDTKGLRISGNEMCVNNAGGIYISGAVSNGLVEANEIIGNSGTSKWMSGIVLTDIEPQNAHDIWEDFDRRHEYPLRDDVFGQEKSVHDIIIRNNKITDNRSLGLYSDGAYRCYVIGNTISRNNKGGVGLEYGTMGFFVEDNFMEACTDTNYPGVFMNNAAYNILRNNIITDICVGIKLEHTAVRNLIMENVVHGIGNGMDQTYGIEIGAEFAEDKTEIIDYTPSYENIICRNSITGNHYSGIFIDEGCYVNDVFDNVIMEPRAFAIEAISDMFNSIVNNTFNADIRNEYHGD